MAHKDERAEHERGKEIARLEDLSQGREANPIPLEMGYAQVVQPSIPATTGRGHGGELTSPNTRAQWDRLLPEVPLPLGLLAKGRDMDFVYVAHTVDR